MIENPVRNDETGIYSWSECGIDHQAPAITKILKPIIDLSGIPPDVLDYASARGKAVHRAVELWENGTLDLETVHDEINPYLTAWSCFVADMKWKTLLSEHFVRTTGRMRVAGTLDAFGTVNIDGKGAMPTVLDIKSSKEIPRSVGPQTWGYRLAAAHTEPGIADSPWVRRMVVQLRSDATYRCEYLNDPLDEMIFNSCYNIWAWAQEGWKR